MNSKELADHLDRCYNQMSDPEKIQYLLDKWSACVLKIKRVQTILNLETVSIHYKLNIIKEAVLNS